MKKYKIVYLDGREVYDLASNALAIIRKYNISTKENIGTRVFDLGESPQSGQSSQPTAGRKVEAK